MSGTMYSMQLLAINECHLFVKKNNLIDQITNQQLVLIQWGMV